MTDLNETIVHKTIAKKPIYENMKWFDTRNWEDDVAYGSNQIEKLASHFKDTLEKANFHWHIVHKKLCQLKNFTRSLLT